MALSILLYHSAAFVELGWNADATTFLGKLGIYGVSIFFVLSGLSLAHVYSAYFTGLTRVVKFGTRRAFRIWPLLTVVVAIKAAQALYEGNPYSPELLL